LDIGNGKITIKQEKQKIKLPADFCNLVTTKEALIASVFPNIQVNYRNHAWLSQRAILIAKNIDFDALNFTIQNMLSGKLILLKLIDTVVNENEAVHFPTEFLNSLDFSDLPPHNLQLKIGSLITLLRNINPP